MKKSSEKKYSHLTYKDRSVIHEFLNYGYSFTSIGNRIHKDRTTVAKEVKLHRFVKPYGKSKDIVCPILSKPPYVCNGCHELGQCRRAKLIYDAAIADHEYRQTLSLQRANLKVTKDQIAAINDVIAPLMVHKHHSVNHLFASHPELLPFIKANGLNVC